MPSTLIAYSTTDGHTLKICERIQKVLEEAGATVVLLDIGSGPARDLQAFDTIVLGASIRYGKHTPEVYRFIESNRDVMDRKPNAFFSVNVVARKAGKETPESNPYIRAFRSKTSWIPTLIGVFAGKIDYPRYRYMDRQFIRLIMWITHGPTDPKGCTDFTNWPAVDNFAQRISKLGAT